MNRRGFTLIEYLVVVGLVALTSSLAYPSYRRWLRQETTHQTAEQLADLLRTAQERSVGEQLIYGVLIEPDVNQAYLISYGDSFQPSAQYSVVDERSFNDQTALVDVGIIDASSSTNQVRFTAAGAPSTTGSVRVTNTVGGTDWLVAVQPSGATRVSSLDE